MAALETTTRNIILANEDIAAMIGDRVRPLGVAPDDERPYLTYQIDGRETFDTLASGPADYRRATIELGVYGDDYATVMDLAELLRNYLDGFGGTVSGIEADVDFDSETDTEEVVPDGEDQQSIYVRVMTFRTLYRAV